MTTADRVVSAPETEPAPSPPDKPLGAIRALKVAFRTTWRQPQLYVLTVFVMQLFLLLIVTPLMRLLYSLVLFETGLGSLAYDKIATVLTNPLALLTLLVLAVVAAGAVLLELVTLFTLASHHQAGQDTSFRLVLHQVGQTFRKLLHPQGVLIVVYLLLLVPLGQFGTSATLTRKIAVPPFISDELAKSPTTAIIYTAVMLILLYVNIRLVLSLPVLATTDASVWQSFVTSWRLTRWRSLRLLGLVVLSFMIAGLFIASLFITAVVPTILTDLSSRGLSPLMATVGLGLWQVGGFMITALLTVTIVQGLIACVRDWLPRLPERHRHEAHLITYSVASTVSARLRRILWLVTIGATVLAFGVASIFNYGRMTRLAATDQTEIIAHRGFIEGGVENTLPALQAADRAGSNRVEFDILQTKDLKFVVIHDSNLQRLAGVNANVKDLTQAELMDITVRADGMEAKIPSLEQWIVESRKLNLPGLLEVKLHGGESPDLLPRLLAVTDQYRVSEWFTYHSISRPIVEDLKRLRPSLRVGFIVPINFGGVPRVTANFLVIEQASYSDEFRNEAWGKGYQVVVWTVQEEQQMRLYIDDDLNGLITDLPNLAAATRDDIKNDEGLAGRLIDTVVRSSSA
jgi:glycerophosphoryl diester phosphodiesterase